MSPLQDHTCRLYPLHIVPGPAPSSKPPSHRDDALAIVQRLRANGHTAFYAGGCVRDALLGLDPKDYDVATDAPPQRVRELFTNTQAVGAAFGVILVRHGKSVVEVATFRTDVSYEDGRRPTAVRFTTAEEDAKRRDFTINGLFFDPVDNRVIDYVGGQEDLKNKVLRAIGDPELRFAEDHLRLLRAVRFAARFALEIEAGTANAIKRHAEHLKRISPERIAEELRQILMPPTRQQGWLLLHELRLIPVLFRFFDPPRDNGHYFIADLPTTGHVSFGLALAAAYLDLVQPPSNSVAPAIARPPVAKAARALRQLFKISNEEADDFVDTFSNLVPLLSDSPPTLAQQKRFLARPSRENSMVLLESIEKVGLGPSHVSSLLDSLKSLSQTDYAPPPLVTGDDLAAAGWTPGPIFKRVLDTVYDAQLEGRITSREDAIRLAEELRQAS